ncbi:MAG: YfbK domain-containing protein [bacterium]
MKKQLFNFLIAVLLSATTLMGQTRTISGTVTDATDGQPLPGVSISLKGTSTATVTDLNGFYSITINGRNPVLVFSFIGMVTIETRAGKENRIDVAMTPDVLELEEVVVGYGTSRRWGKSRQNRATDYESSQNVYASQDADYNSMDDESYASVTETGFKEVVKDPLSTFSIDVDNAAYANIRRFINQGQLPPADAVRVEEMLNYFSYNYPEPRGKHPFAVHTELSECPWNPHSQLLHVGLNARELNRDELLSSNLVFLIDVSGSMRQDNRLPLVKTAMKMLLEELSPDDRVAVVVYSGRTETVLESTPVKEKGKIIAAISGLDASGSTAGGQALRRAYDVAERNFLQDGNNRIIMCTDGDFNVGETSLGSMEKLVSEKRKRGVYLTVMGFGMGNYKDDRLEIIANKGNGNYGYIDNIQEARKLLINEFAGTLYTLANDVKLQIEFNPARVKAYRLIGYENRRLNPEDFNDDAKDAGELGAGHSVTALYEIIPAGSDATFPGSIDKLRYQENAPSVMADNHAELLTLKARYKEGVGKKSVKFEEQVQGNPLSLASASEDFRFAAAVAELGLLLLDSPYKGEASFENVVKLAVDAKGDDHDGYRAEFVNLVRTAQNLQKLSMQR